MIIGHLDISDKNISTEEQKQAIEQYAITSNFAVDVFFSDALPKLIDSLQTPGHTLILANTVGLGNSLSTIKDNLSILVARGLTIICIKENLVIEPNQEAEWLIKGIELSINLRNSMVSTITKKALDNKRAQGYKLGRDFGLKNKRYIWEGKEEGIKKRLSSGMTRQKTADEVGISIASLYNYLKQTPELKNMTSGDQNA